MVPGHRHEVSFPGRQQGSGAAVTVQNGSRLPAFGSRTTNVAFNESGGISPRFHPAPTRKWQSAALMDGASQIWPRRRFSISPGPGNADPVEGTGRSDTSPRCSCSWRASGYLPSAARGWRRARRGSRAARRRDVAGPCPLPEAARPPSDRRVRRADPGQMTTHRCGMPDPRRGRVLHPLRLAETAAHLRVRGRDDDARQAEFQAVRNAFATWAAAVPVIFTEAAATQTPDIAIDWRPANDPDHSMVGGVLAHADFPPAAA